MAKEDCLIRARVTQEEFDLAVRLGNGNMSRGIRIALASVNEERARNLDRALADLKTALETLEALRTK